MSRLPEKFPEYLIMYKTLTKKISDLNDEKAKLQDSELEKIQNRIKEYESEITRITNMFPKKFFDDYSLE